MASFSRTASADARAPCKACCRADHARDDALSRATTARIAALASRREPVRAAVPAAAAVGAPDSGVVGCAQQARALAPVVQRFDRYREALPSARAAADLSELGDESGNEASARPCLTRLPARAGPLGSAL